MAKQKKPKIGLALGSGGFKGTAAHIGIIKELIKAKIPIDYIAGSSSGSVVGGIYAATKDLKKLEKKFLEMKPKDYLYWFSDITLTSGLVKGDKATEFLKQFIGTKNIRDCKIEFRPVCTNLETGRTVTIEKGKLAEGIRASCAVPLILRPIKYGKRWLVDGGTSMPVPVQVVKDMGANIVIAVNMNAKLGKIKKLKAEKEVKFSKLSIIDHSISILLHHLAKINIKYADIVISPDISEYGNLNMGEYLGTSRPIKAGQKATKKAIPHIKEKIEKWTKSKESQKN